jgi:hypothetical protein
MSGNLPRQQRASPRQGGSTTCSLMATPYPLATSDEQLSNEHLTRCGGWRAIEVGRALCDTASPRTVVEWLAREDVLGQTPA